MTDRLHQIRADNPELGFALYAMTPGEPVTLEVHTPDGQVFTFIGATATAALDTAFPPAPVTPAETPDPIDTLFGDDWPTT